MFPRLFCTTALRLPPRPFDVIVAAEARRYACIDGQTITFRFFCFYFSFGLHCTPPPMINRNRKQTLTREDFLLRDSIDDHRPSTRRLIAKHYHTTHSIHKIPIHLIGDSFIHSQEYVEHTHLYYPLHFLHVLHYQITQDNLQEDNE